MRMHEYADTDNDAESDRTYQCHRCNATFNEEWELDEHLAGHGEAASEVAGDVSNQRPHASSQPIDNDSQSDGDLGGSSDNGDDPKDRITSETFECENCGASIKSLVDYDDHLVGHGEAPVHWSDDEEMPDSDDDNSLDDDDDDIRHGIFRRFTATRNTKSLAAGGYEYRIGRRLRNFHGIPGQCSHRGCNGRIHLLSRRTIQIITEHNHAPSYNRNDVSIALHTMRRLARRHPTMRPRDIVINSTVGMPDAARAALPSARAIRQMLHREKNKIWAPVKKAKTLRQVQIPPSYRSTRSGKVFLQFDTGENDERRIIGFGTDSGLMLMSKAPTVGGDGTFKFVPSPPFR